MVNSISNIFQEIVGFNSLYRGFRRARKGKRNHPEVLSFAVDLEEKLLKLSRELKKGFYESKGFKRFKLFDPKEREIYAPYFRDRIVHRSLYANLEPFFNRKFIYDSFACRGGKGTHGAVDRVQYFLRKSDADYFVKCDVRSYFDSVDHSILLEKLERYIKDNNLIDLIKEIISDYGDVGLPIGTLYSQLFANIYLNGFDHFVKQKLQADYYVRYMDDFVFFSDSKQDLHNFRDQSRGYLRDNLNLELPYSKTTLEPVDKGLTFLGYRIFPDHRLLRKRNKKNFRKRLRNQKTQLESDKISLSEVKNSVESWEGHAKHADTAKLREDVLGGLNSA